ncbi:hypothetical protein ACFYOF_28115 [Streptomyces sp. NPDC007148]|uniref:hypothetical protein n=1 Tax=unclassified Streptomyces TaxID=2593676 RepID=UPI0036C0385D
MHDAPRPHGQVLPAPDHINERIRTLMDEPPTQERCDAYLRLLLLWAEVSDDDLTTAA